MPREKRHIRFPHGGQLRQTLRKHLLLPLGQRIHGGWGEADRPSEQLPFSRIIQLVAGKINHRHVMLPAAKGRHNLRCAGERHCPLGGGPPCEHGHTHQRIPASWCSRSYRVTMPTTLPSRRTKAAGVVRDKSVVSCASGE